jgi:hypothetical protein
MFGYRRKTYEFPDWKGSWCQLNFLITLLLVAYLISGCNSTSSKQFYENSESGISLAKPKNWDLGYSERNGMIVLVAENGIWDKDSARIEIQGPACLPKTSSFNSPKEELEWNIYRIGMLYYLDSVTIIQEPTKVKTGDYEVTKAVIAIPTMSMLDDSARNQVGDPGPDIFQAIDMFAITGGDNTIMAYVYKGNSEALNAEAQEIVDSIQLTCSPEP